MKNHRTHAVMTPLEKLSAWCQLIRLDKPVGTELLLYPTLWALFLASAQYGKLPSIQLLFIFALGAFLMRSAGCAVNDFADRKVDGRVLRTKGRPLADGRLSAKTAVLTFVSLALLSAGLLLFLPIAVFYYALIALVLAFVYPFMKRYTHLPQLVLAAAFGWAVPMAFVAVQGKVGAMGWLIFFAYLCWTVAYDTQYAMSDREDDLKIGVKSSAILFGKLFGAYEVWAIVFLQALFGLIMVYCVWWLDGFWLVLFAYLMFSFYQQYQLIKTGERHAYFLAFGKNAMVGRVVFALIVISCLSKFYAF